MSPTQIWKLDAGPDSVGSMVGEWISQGSYDPAEAERIVRSLRRQSPNDTFETGDENPPMPAEHRLLGTRRDPTAYMGGWGR